MDYHHFKPHTHKVFFHTNKINLGDVQQTQTQRSFKSDSSWRSGWSFTNGSLLEHDITPYEVTKSREKNPTKKKCRPKVKNNRRMAKRAICVVHLSIRDRSLGWVYPDLFFLGAMGRPTYDHQPGIIQKFQDITYDIHHLYLQCTSLVLSWM